MPATTSLGDVKPNNILTLKTYRTANYSAGSLSTWFKDKSININADYQRDIVWSNFKQSGLIDSLFHNYYIPPIIFAVIQQDDGGEVRVCIDGKQRLTAIHWFIMGDIPYTNPNTNEKLYYAAAPGEPSESGKRLLLSAQQQAIFRNKQIACVEYDTITQEQEREIFQRVQLGVTLKPSEKLPAINGPYADIVRELVLEFDSIKDFGKHFPWGKLKPVNDQTQTDPRTHRARDFQAVAQMLYMISKGRGTKKEPTHVRLATYLSQEQIATGDQDIRNDLSKAANALARIFRHSDVDQPFSSLEFIISNHLIYIYQKKTPNTSDIQIRDAILSLRQNIDGGGPSLKKLTTANFKTALGFIPLCVPNDLGHVAQGKRKRPESNEEGGDIDNKTVPQKKKARTVAGSGRITVTLKKPIAFSMNTSYSLIASERTNSTKTQVAVPSGPKPRVTSRFAQSCSSCIAGPSKSGGATEKPCPAPTLPSFMREKGLRKFPNFNKKLREVSEAL